MKIGTRHAPSCAHLRGMFLSCARPAWHECVPPRCGARPPRRAWSSDAGLEGGDHNEWHEPAPDSPEEARGPPPSAQRVITAELATACRRGCRRRLWRPGVWAMASGRTDPKRGRSVKEIPSTPRCHMYRQIELDRPRFTRIISKRTPSLLPRSSDRRMPAAAATSPCSSGPRTVPPQNTLRRPRNVVSRPRVVPP